MHHRKDIYVPDADQLRPKRWENDALEDVGWGYLSFNGDKGCSFTTEVATNLRTQ
jgi:hypothetical protein